MPRHLARERLAYSLAAVSDAASSAQTTANDPGQFNMCEGITPFDCWSIMPTGAAVQSRTPFHSHQNEQSVRADPAALDDADGQQGLALKPHSSSESRPSSLVEMWITVRLPPSSVLRMVRRFR
jgi:hypothetical protein